MQGYILQLGSNYYVKGNVSLGIFLKYPTNGEGPGFPKVT